MIFWKQNEIGQTLAKNPRINQSINQSISQSILLFKRNQSINTLIWAVTLTFQRTGSVGSVSRTVSQHKLTDVLTAVTICRPSPVSSAITRVHFSADQVNITPTASLENLSVADEECAISFVIDIIVPQLTLVSEADFNQLVKYGSDSDCIDVDSTDFDLEQLVNGQNLR